MKSILITGNKGVGKTTLAKLIAGDKPVTISDIKTYHKFLEQSTEVLIIDKMSTKKDLEKFEELIERESIFFRQPYHSSLTKISPLIIGIYQGKLGKNQDIRGLLKTTTFNLKY
jgi:broad-specificity NMP kinase